MKKTLMGYNKDDVETKMAELQETIKMYECKISVLEDRFAQAQKTIMDINSTAKNPQAENAARVNPPVASQERPAPEWNNAISRPYAPTQNAMDNSLARNVQLKGAGQNSYSQPFTPAPAEYGQSSFARSFSSEAADSMEKNTMDSARQPLFARSYQSVEKPAAENPLYADSRAYNPSAQPINYEKARPENNQYAQARPYNAAPPQPYEKPQVDRRQYIYAYDCASSIVKSSQKNVEDFISSVSAQSAYAEEQAKKVLMGMQQMKVDLQKTVDSILEKAQDLQQQINDMIEQASSVPQAYNNFGQIQQEINKNIERQIYDYLQRSQEFLDQSEPTQEQSAQNYVWNQ
jgi:hypothetical protein